MTLISASRFSESFSFWASIMLCMFYITFLSRFPGLLIWLQETKMNNYALFPDLMQALSSLSYVVLLAGAA